jgi:hypothetical protein
MNKNKATSEGDSSTGVSPYLIPIQQKGIFKGEGISEFSTEVSNWGIIH